MKRKDPDYSLLYAWRVSRSDEFPESTFVLNAVPVAVEHEANAVLHEIPVLR